MDLRVKVALALTLLLLCTSVQAATIYRWTDAQGRVHYGDEPPSGQRAERIHADGRRAGAGPSERVRQIRCRDFRGALVQLDAVNDVEPDNPQWLAARQLAKRRIEQWCD